MSKELLIDGYLFLFKVLFNVCKFFPLKKKVVFVCSYTDNSQFVYDELTRREEKTEVVFLCRGKAACDHFAETGERIVPIETMRVGAMVRSAYHLATAKVIVIDNYFGFLAAAAFKKTVVCIQLWHACGAFKTFGLEDHSVALRTARARKRFLNVYRHFDKIVVGSDAMQEIFKQSFGLDESHFIHLGIPRTDLFFDLNREKQAEKSLHWLSSGKKLLLYAPTFRDPPMHQLALNLAVMKKELASDYVLILRLHPLEQKEVDRNIFRDPFIIDGSKWEDVNELLLVTDLLITDYSSIPFEFALLKRPMIFFPYDLHHYEKSRGLRENYTEMVPGPIASSTQELVQMIKKQRFDAQKTAQFSAYWNQYSKGQSSRLVVDYLFDCLSK
ncbi:CDP-glycerol glycerophosphotransferase family protein [Sporolactobacillus terrae]|uniref:CDP-glycerol glycerophosphotransferase family protein n=1 Tax=Sporolactobacillus terrae TaxID=269673 RepID=UPI001119917E|nr:CDP-glycerol glycerophosphotransferase family protein [Sporolactobacillus terrae]